MFLYESSQTDKNNFFIEHLWAIASSEIFIFHFSILLLISLLLV